MSAQTTCRSQGATTQGMYIAGADGSAYGWKNTPGISDTLRFMDKGLTAFKAKPPAKVEISAEDLAKPYTNRAKPQTSVIAVYSRVRPVPPGADARNHHVGLDYLWISKDETQELLDQLAEHQSPALPATLVARLCRFALVDVIRGEPEYWSSSEISNAEFKLRKLDEDDGHIRMAFSGDFKFRTFLFSRGLEGRIEGEFILDAVTGLMNRFRAYAKCKAWGSSELGTRGTPGKPVQLVFGLQETYDPAAREIPPSALSRQMDYAAPRFPKFEQRTEEEQK